jgi:hypothetical protein
MEEKQTDKMIKKMKRISVYFWILSLMLFGYSCKDMYDNINSFVTEEKVYPGGFDRAEGRIGYERVEIDLLEAGRIPASEIKLGKAEKTVIEYDKEVITIDSLCSWVSIEGLTLSKLYRFNIYTIDQYGNKSIPVEIALIPYTAEDLATLVVPSPRIVYRPTETTVSWSENPLMEYCELTFAYTDQSGVHRTGSQTGQRPSIIVDNLELGSQVTVNMRYAAIPKVNNVPIIDTVYFENSLLLNVPLIFDQHYPLDMNDWTATASSYENPSGNWGLPDVILGSPGFPVWHTRYSGSTAQPPHWIEIDMQDMKNITKIEVIRHTDVKTLHVIASETQIADKSTLGNLTPTATLEYPGPWNEQGIMRDCEFETPVSGRYLYLYIPESHRNPYSSIQFIRAFGWTQ